MKCLNYLRLHGLDYIHIKHGDLQCFVNSPSPCILSLVTNLLSCSSGALGGTLSSLSIKVFTD